MTLSYHKKLEWTTTVSDSPTKNRNEIKFSELRDPAEIFELVEFVGNGTYEQQGFFPPSQIKTRK